MKFGILARLLVIFAIVFIALAVLKKILPIAAIGLGFMKFAAVIALILALLVWWKSARR